MSNDLDGLPHLERSRVRPPPRFSGRSRGFRGARVAPEGAVAIPRHLPRSLDVRSIGRSVDLARAQDARACDRVLLARRGTIEALAHAVLLAVGACERRGRGLAYERRAIRERSEPARAAAKRASEKPSQSAGPPSSSAGVRPKRDARSGASAPHGQTSEQTSQPKTQGPMRSWSSWGIGPRFSIVWKEMQSRASTT